MINAAYWTEDEGQFTHALAIVWATNSNAVFKIDLVDEGDEWAVHNLLAVLEHDLGIPLKDTVPVNDEGEARQATC
jgi:hypothetical protein